MTDSTIPQLIDTPANIPGVSQYQQLGYVDAYDAVLDADYAFVAYKENDSNGDWRVRIHSSQGAGGVFEPAMMKSNARSTGAQGKPWFSWGWSFDQSAGDSRWIQFRVHVANGLPCEIEIFVQLRKFDGTANVPKSVKFAWPSRFFSPADRPRKLNFPSFHDLV
jgi:hypothetical protein